MKLLIKNTNQLKYFLLFIISFVGGNQVSQLFAKNNVNINICILGMPAVGKSTIIQTIQKRYPELYSVSMGNELRKKLGPDNPILKSGNIVDNKIVEGIIAEILAQHKNNIIWDGFPRDSKAVQSLYNFNHKIDIVFFIESSEDILIDRISGRRVHLPSGRTYHIKNKPPKIADKDDITGEPLSARDDDKKEVIQHRIEVYKKTKEEIMKCFLGFYADKLGAPVIITIHLPKDSSVEQNCRIVEANIKAYVEGKNKY